MPLSSTEGKDWVRRRVLSLATQGTVSVLDVGPGEGVFARLLAGQPSCRLVGFETDESEVAAHRLRDLYHEVVVGDARELDWPAVDVVVITEAAEHFTGHAARQLWDKATSAARHAVYLCVRLQHPQAFEDATATVGSAGSSAWDHLGVLSALPGIGDWWLGPEIGVYERRTDGAGAHA